MQLDFRQQAILSALIETYVQTAEPVSSHAILEESGLDCSSATVRNELAELEEMGLVNQPHTSAGRIPTDAGYRYYVNELVHPKAMRRAHSHRIRKELQPLYAEITHILDEACQLLAEMTRYTAVVMLPAASRDMMRHVQMGTINSHRLLVLLMTSTGQSEHKVFNVDSPIPSQRLNAIGNYVNAKLKGKPLAEVKRMRFEELENPLEFHDPFLRKAFELIQQTIPDEPGERVIVEGIAYILQQPEFADVQRAREVVQVLDEGPLVSTAMLDFEDAVAPTVIIGEENRLEQLRRCSFVGMPYHIAGESVGRLGVLGPTRMQYAEVITLVNYLTRRLDEVVALMTGG